MVSISASETNLPVCMVRLQILIVCAKFEWFEDTVKFFIRNKFSSIFTSLCKNNYLLVHSSEWAAIAFWWNNLGTLALLFKNHQTLVPHYPYWSHQCLVTAHKWSNIGLSDHQTLLWPSLFGVFTCVSGHCIWSIKYWTIFINCYIIWHQIAGTANQVTKVTGS